MVQIVLVSHADLGEALIRAVEMIAGPQEGLHALSLTPSDRPEDFQGRFATLMDSLAGEEVLVLIDLMGGTPYNVVARQLFERPIECVTGANLPMLLELVFSREEYPASELAEHIAQAGKDSVNNLGPMLRGRIAANSAASA